MTDYREILRLNSLGRSQRSIARDDDRGCPMDFVEGTRIEKEMMHDFERDPATFLTQ